jgi:adenylosuccinate synthase
VDKAGRVGIQVADVMEPAVLESKLRVVLPEKNRVLTEVYGQEALRLDDLISLAAGWRDRYADLVVDQVPLVTELLERNARVLLEGQLGALRDLDWGTYPYVTSSSTIAGGGAVGGGVPPMHIRSVVGVVKAYTTAVGAGPLPSEISGQAAEDLRRRGGEYGATTGRPRRIGWFDAVAARYSRMLNGFTSIAVTKLDVLDGLPTVPVCTAYRLDGRRLDTVPIEPLLERVEPEYEELPGWEGPTSSAQSLEDLPVAARRYLDRLEELVGAPITIVSVGPGRHETILQSGPVPADLA